MHPPEKDKVVHAMPSNRPLIGDLGITVGRNALSDVASSGIQTGSRQTYAVPDQSRPGVSSSGPDPRQNFNYNTPDRSEPRSIGAVGSSGVSTLARDFADPNKPLEVPRLSFSVMNDGPGTGTRSTPPFPYAQTGQTTTLVKPFTLSPSGTGLTDQPGKIIPAATFSPPSLREPLVALVPKRKRF
ncbi:MAG TPA: hypothetical protein VE955_07225 [Candidatus Dormibacteraeota bacterium]|nr:hypothetical protein [Candidatus Dormibacteraeota bacterium]